MATDETVSTIAKALGESEETPLSQIAGVVRALGEEQARRLLDETKEIEAKGGMMLPDNSRKRSAGGVFFFLARQKLSRDDKLAIFRPPKEPKSSTSAPQSESSPFPRRRVIEVAPSSRSPQSRPPRAGFVPPDLPEAVRRVRARESVLSALSGLQRETQYDVLLEVLAELHDQLGYRLPESRTPARSATAFDPPTRPGAPMMDVPPSQRPIPVVIPESSRRASERPQATAPESKAELPTPTRRANSAGTRTTTTKRR